MNADEQLLVQRAREGDTDSFRILFDRYHRGIFHVIYGLLGDREEAADLTQEAFVRVHRSLGRLRAEGAFGAWLKRIAINLCRDHRKQRRLPTSSLEATSAGAESAWAEEPAGGDDSAASGILGAELRAQVRRALRQLSVDRRTVVVLHHLEGHPVDEIARLLGCSVGTVKSRLSRARDELRRALKPYLEE